MGGGAVTGRCHVIDSLGARVSTPSFLAPAFASSIATARFLIIAEGISQGARVSRRWAGDFLTFF
jgi:hypothetical protein